MADTLIHIHVRQNDPIKLDHSEKYTAVDLGPYGPHIFFEGLDHAEQFAQVILAGVEVERARKASAA